MELASHEINTGKEPGSLGAGAGGWLGRYISAPSGHTWDLLLGCLVTHTPQ